MKKQSRRSMLILSLCLMSILVFTACPVPADAMGADIGKVGAWQEGDETGGAEESALPEGSESTSFSFLDGKLTVQMDEAAYDVFLKDNTGQQDALLRQGFSQEKMDLYMSAVGYDLMGIPAGQMLSDGLDYRFILHIKDPDYEGLSNFKDLGTAQEKLLADMMAASFGGVSYELVETDSVDYIVFEALGSVRYATIIDEHMIYFYIKSENGTVTDEHREALRKIMEGVVWSLN